jgi:hypothetical protein
MRSLQRDLRISHAKIAESSSKIASARRTGTVHTRSTLG